MKTTISLRCTLLLLCLASSLLCRAQTLRSIGVPAYYPEMGPNGNSPWNNTRFAKISTDGSTMVGGHGSTGNGSRAWKWTNDWWEYLEGPGNSHVTMSHDGQTVALRNAIIGGGDRVYFNGQLIYTSSTDRRIHDISADGSKYLTMRQDWSVPHVYIVERGNGTTWERLPDHPWDDWIGNLNEVMCSANGMTVAGNDHDFPYLWRGGAPMRLGPTLDNDYNTEAHAISENGRVVVGYRNYGDDFAATEDPRVAIRWVDGVEHILPTPAGWRKMAAHAVSGDGSVIVGRYLDPDDYYQAFIWRAETGVMRLLDYFRDYFGIDTQFWWLNTADLISGDGKVMVGIGWEPGGENIVWRFEEGVPLLGLDLAPGPGDPGVGETVILQARVFNYLASVITDVAPEGDLEFSGSGELELVSGPTPAIRPQIEPDDYVDFEWEFKAVKRGDVTVAVQMLGFDFKNDPVYSERISCSPIRIGSRGDLKVRAASEGELSYAGNDLYQTVPAGVQIERVSAHPDGTAVYKVLVENDAPADSASGATGFVLRAETAPEGWTLAASRDASDILAALTGPDGWETPRLDPGASVEITVTLTPDPGIAKGVEKSVRLTLRSTGESVEALDSVEARSVVEDSWMTVDPSEALLGEKVAVVLHFFNDTTTAMTLVTPALGALPAPLGDAEISEPQPASIPVLQPGTEAVFTYEVRGIAKGEANLLGQVSYHQNGGGPFFTSMIQRILKTDRIEAVDLEPVQAIPDVPMISGKPAVALLTTHNPLTIPKKVALKLTVKQWGEPDQVLDVTPTLKPGEQTEFIPKEGSFSITAPGELQIEIEPENPHVHDYPGRQLTSEFDTVETHQLNYVYCRPVFAARYALPAVDPSYFGTVAAVNSAYLDATYPMIPLGAPAMDVLEIDWTTRPVTPASIFSAAERKAVRDGLERIVLVLPPHPAMVDIPPDEMAEVLGYTYGGKVAIFIDHSPNPPSENTTAHEIGHTFGFPDDLLRSEPDVPLGIRVARSETIEDTFNFMTYVQPTWVNKVHYEALISFLSRPVIDPVVVLLSGSITPGGEVTADSWTTITTDQLSVPDPGGAYAMEFLDSSGAVLQRFRFGLEFELTEGTVSSSGEVGSVIVQLQEVPFCFSIVRPPGLARVALRGPANQVLFSRNVSSNPPVVSSLSVSPAGPYVPGQQRTVSWTASDPDGDPLTYALLYSEDGGAKWKLACEFLEGNQCTWTVPDAATARGMLKVEASDGVNSGTRQSAAFSIASNQPRLIVNPGLKAVTRSGIAVALDGTASHSSDGQAVSFLWSLAGQPTGGDGILTNATSGTAGFLATTPGLYTVKLEVRTPAPGALSASAFTTVFVEANELPDLTFAKDAGGRFSFSWPLSSPGAVLQSSDDLQLWKSVPEVPGQADGDYRLLFDPSGPVRKFFRLNRPAAGP